VVEGKGSKYRLIPMNSVVRGALLEAMQDRSPAGFVFDADRNGVNEISLRWGFEEACGRAEIVYGETKPGGIIWHDRRRTFATRLRANGVYEYDIQDLLGHAKPGVTKVYAPATLTVLKGAVDKLTEPNNKRVKIADCEFRIEDPQFANPEDATLVLTSNYIWVAFDPLRQYSCWQRRSTA